jgi:hypothetical protein
VPKEKRKKKMQNLGLVLWVFALVFFALAAIITNPPYEPHRVRCVAAGLMCIAIAQVFGLGSKAFGF